METHDSTIPVTVISGYLGSGKSTLLNRLLSEEHGRRLAVVVNDFGSINIDAQLIQSRDAAKINLANGCVCCSLGNDLATTLCDLAASDTPPEQILVEASGVSQPAAVARGGHLPGLYTNAIFVLVDAANIRQLAGDKFVGTTVIRQLHQAGVLILNKVDLIDSPERAVLKSWLAEQAPGVPVLETSHGDVATALILDDEQSLSIAVEPDSQHTHIHKTWNFETEAYIDEAILTNFANTLPEGILRAKGIVQLGPQRATTIYQQVGTYWHLTPCPQTNQKSQVVAIGYNDTLPPDWLEKVLSETA